MSTVTTNKTQTRVRMPQVKKRLSGLPRTSTREGATSVASMATRVLIAPGTVVLIRNLVEVPVATRTPRRFTATASTARSLAIEKLIVGRRKRTWPLVEKEPTRLSGKGPCQRHALTAIEVIDLTGDVEVINLTGDDEVIDLTGDDVDAEVVDLVSDTSIEDKKSFDDGFFDSFGDNDCSEEEEEMFYLHGARMMVMKLTLFQRGSWKVGASMTTSPLRLVQKPRKRMMLRWYAKMSILRTRIPVWCIMSSSSLGIRVLPSLNLTVTSSTRSP
jgi:hypothetical protein